jgi:hypothetical protein
MKTLKMLRLASLAIALALTCGAVHGQVTPQAVIGNVPGLPSPQQWASGNTQAFKDKIAELNGKLSEIQAKAIPDVSQTDFQQAAAYQQQSMAQTQRRHEQDMAQAQHQMAAMGLTEADLIKMQNMSEKEMEAFMRQRMQASPEYQSQMAVFEALGITEADMKKMEKMNERQSEAFIKQRMKERGVTEADLGRIVAGQGGSMLSEAEWQAEQRREQQAQASGEAMIKAQETLEAYMEQMQITSKKTGEAEQVARKKVEAVGEKYRPLISKAQGEANQWEEVMRGTKTKEELESLGRKAEALVLEYREQAYQAWTEYIHAAQGHLKFLMQYAVAADDARAKMPAMTGNAATDQLQRMSNNAIAVAGQYLAITASEPEI